MTVYVLKRSFQLLIDWKNETGGNKKMEEGPVVII